ncbi:hypothetical protein NQ176_g2592 [Zarea fungicola]|uniref:Uncharacterized protein n=1 Tax=Zarea fungicola TaxID=93591 RepID=A0ACC1NMM1_9HYPO|nr:hypothetical protein NQ176_g2592 [Lecanicillium fungicola]
MSQKGPTADPASHPPVTSPVKYEQVSPRTRPAHLGHQDVLQMQEASTGNGQTLGPNSQGKGLGMYSILNPTETCTNTRDGGVRQHWQESDQVARSRTTLPPGVHGQGETTSVSLPGTPGVSTIPNPQGRPPISGRNSPATGYPFAATNQRRPPSPESLQGSTHPRAEMRRPQLQSGIAGTKRPFSYAGDGHLELKPPQYSHHHPSSSLPNAGTMLSPLKAPTQPVPPIDGRQGAAGPPPPGDFQRYSEGPHSNPQLHQGHHLSHGGAPAVVTADGGPAWPEMIRRPGLGGPMITSDGQQAFMTLPGSEIPIPVQVDYSQASKKADEKRQRNAKASTRHRRKKKNMQEENIRMLQDLKDEQDSMAQQITALTRQRDFYREERNRLRDIVLRTPAISQHASGPPSPISARSVTSYADHSPAGGQPQPLTTPSQGYLSEASSVERPSQRRRTGDHTEYATNYSTQPGLPPTTLPPMQSHTPGMPPRPMSAHLTAHQERLPPLRVIDGPLQPPQEIHTGHSTHERDPVTGDWRVSQPRPYETGWATPRHFDNHQR